MLTTGKNFYHSHPASGSPDASTADRDAAKYYHDNWGYENFYIYYPHWGDYMRPYDPNDNYENEYY